jgi:formylglycine-generating enzyme required for sulfatase activity
MASRVFCALLLCTLLAVSAEPGMVLIPGGDFLRGRTYEWEDYDMPWSPNPAKDDRPVRKISLDPFYLDESEVTNERYAAFLKATQKAPPYYWRNGQIPEGKEKHPVVNVDWNDAAAFCKWVGKRLPTEAEFERACRGTAEGKMFPWGDRVPTDKDAHYGALNGATGVCQKARSEFGLCDIIGNVWEWTADWYDRKYYEIAPERNPKGPDSGLYRAVRGGSWFDQPKLFLSCSYRSWARPAERSPTIGFRCAKNVTN